jgi:hypothetical protein
MRNGWGRARPAQQEVNVSLGYIAEKLFAAVEALALDTRPLRERLYHAHADWVSRVRLHADHLPEPERKLLDSIESALTRVKPTGQEGSLLATVRAMSDEEAARVIERIVMLLQRVTWAAVARPRPDGGPGPLPYHPSAN